MWILRLIGFNRPIILKNPSTQQVEAQNQDFSTFSRIDLMRSLVLSVVQGSVYFCNYPLFCRSNNFSSTGVYHSCQHIIFVTINLFQDGTVQDLIERTAREGGHIPELDILHMFKSLCDAILAFHSLDPPLAHRDIKVCIVNLDYSNFCLCCIKDSLYMLQVKIKFTG